MTGPSRLCVLADPYLRTDQVRTLERAVDQTGIDVGLVIVNDPVEPDLDPDAVAVAMNNPLGIDTARILTDVIRHERAWAVVYAEKKLDEALGRRPSTGRVAVEDVECLDGAPFEVVVPIQDGSWSELPLSAVERARSTCDVAVRFGFGLLRGEILDALEFGVLSFHPADIREYRGLGVPQAWLDGRECMGVTLQRLNDNIDGGEIIAFETIDVSHCATLWETYDELFALKASMLATGIERLRDPDFDPWIPESLGPYYSVEKRHHISFAGRTLLKNMAGRIERVTG